MIKRWKKEKMSSKKINVGVNGVGRIGRGVVRAMQKYPELRLVAVNDLAPPKTLGFLLAHDSVHGAYPGISVEGSKIDICGRPVEVFSEREPNYIPWDEKGVDVVVESTGLFRSRIDAKKHLSEGGVKKVLITAPGKNPDATIVPGVNDAVYDKKAHNIISLASCTTNALAPVLKTIDDFYGVENGFMSVVHAFTGDQPILDLAGKDLRRSRAGAMNIIPTSTGAASAIGDVLPTLKGKLDGLAIRVPVCDVSIVDLVVKIEGKTSLEGLNRSFEKMATHIPHILKVSTEPLVSSDYIGDPHSAILDALTTMVIDDNMVKVLIWFDNEIGYSNRVVEFAKGCLE